MQRPATPSKPFIEQSAIIERPPVKELVQAMEKAKKDRWIRPVSFNLLDPIESKLSAHAATHSNFSSYIKKLVQRDLEGSRSKD